MARFTWHGHATFSVETNGGERLMFDPFLDENPASSLKVAAVDRLDWILCSHGHFDHFQDAVALALQTGASVVGTFELANFVTSRGVKDAHGLNIGGAHTFPFGRLKLTPALHSGTIDGDDEGRYTSVAHGFLIDLDGTRFYYSGDTALISELQLLRDQVDIAVLPIGDYYTMGPEDAARAVDWIRPRVVIPVHYDTWPPIAQDTEAFRRLIGDRAQLQVLRPGESYDF